MNPNDLIKTLSLSEDRAFFVYDFSVFLENLKKVRNQFKRHHSKVNIFFSLKANPNLQLISFIRDHVDGFDVSSLREWRALKDLGVAPNKISFSGPGKTQVLLEEAQGVFAVHVDSLEEWKICDRLGLPMSLRWGSPVGKDRKLGLSRDEILFVLTHSKVNRFLGLHVYLGREAFSVDSAQKCLQELNQLMRLHPDSFVKEPTLFLGPGLTAAEEVSDPLITECALTLEIGRGLMGSAGLYVVPVLAVKNRNQDRKSVIVNGGLQHLGSPLVSPRVPLKNLQPPCYRKVNGLWTQLTEKRIEVQVAGSLCLSHDTLHPRVLVPESLQRGDRLVFENCGAYGLTAGVPFFIGQDLPQEFLLDTMGVVKNISPKNFIPYHQGFDLEKILGDLNV